MQVFTVFPFMISLNHNILSLLFSVFGTKLSKQHLVELRQVGNMLACSAGVFRTRECTFSYQAAILDLVTVEDWGEEIEGGGVKFRKWARASPILLYRSSIQDGGNENPIYYLAFRSKITPALQASNMLSGMAPHLKFEVGSMYTLITRRGLLFFFGRDQLNSSVMFVNNQLGWVVQSPVKLTQDQREFCFQF